MQIPTAFPTYTCYQRKFSTPKVLLGLCAIILCLNSKLHAQPFTLSSASSNIPALSNAKIIFANVDNSQTPMILATGKDGSASATFTGIFRLEPNTNTYIDNLSDIEDLRNSSADFGDFNRDGNLDLAICGLDVSNIKRTYVYPGNGANIQTYGVAAGSTPFSLTGVDRGSMAWGDYDNDGDQDLAVIGRNQSQLPSISIYEYDDENNVFDQDTRSVLVPLYDGSLAWGDYDSDGDLDLIMTGMGDAGGNSPKTRLYANTGDGFLVNRPIANLPNAGAGSVAWGDYDNDGDLDILLSGETSTGLITQVFENRGNNSFQLLNANLTGIRDGESQWIDYDNDGFLDIILAGKSGTGNNDRVMELYRNNQSGGFNLIAVPAFTGLDDNASIAVGYINADKKLDLAVVGQTLFGGTLGHFLYENQDTNPNTTPAQLTLNTPQQVATSVNFSWNASTTPGASYNVYIGTTAVNEDIEPSLANRTTGERKIFKTAHIQDNSWSIKGLDAGVYSIHVQAVDQDFEGGPFSAVEFFTYTPPVTTASTFTQTTSQAFFTTLPSGIRNGDLQWGNIDSDDRLDLLVVGAGQTGNVIEIWRQNSSNQFDQVQTQITDAMDLSDAAWADYDNDGDLDLLVSGRQPIIGSSIFLYDNDLSVSGNFIKNTTLSNQLEGVELGSLDWGDYDNDGDLDILLTGRANLLNAITRIYRNDYNASTNTRSFTNAFSPTDFIQVENGDAEFADFNNDGWLDFLVVGRNNGGGDSQMYENNGDGTFMLKQANIVKLDNASIEWADFNNDGNIDVAVCGTNVSNIPQTTLYRNVSLNNGSIVVFTTISTPLPPFTDGELAFGDYNDDGFTDLVITGEDFDGDAQTQAFFNTGDPLGAFQLDQVSSSDLSDLSQGSSVAWGDYDNDKKLDLVIAGSLGGGGTNVTQLYRNVNPVVNNIPGPPTGLGEGFSGFDVKFFWQPPSNHVPSSAVNGLTYAIYIDTVGGSGPVDVRSPHSETAGGTNFGLRKIVHTGEIGTNLSYTLKGLRPGVYTWSVQAIDQDFEGSAFAPERTFTYELPTFINTTNEYFVSGLPTPLTEASVAWGDYTGDGYLDIAVCGTDGNGNSATDLYEFVLPNFFVTGGTNTSSIPDVKNGSLDWGDFDNDQDMDLLITGRGASGPITRIYENLNSGFTAIDTLQFVGLENSASKWADLNNDGRLDFIISGRRANGTPISQTYIQNAAGSFTGSNLSEAVENASIDVGDYNNDGYLDFLLSGKNGTTGKGILYKNDQNGGFSEVPAGLAEVVEGAVCFGDYNADGFLDIAQIGENSGGTRISRIILNNKNGTFTLTPNSVDAISSGNIHLGDYNNDGLKDILIVGKNGGAAADRTVKLYRYDVGSGAFVYEEVASSTFEAVGAGSDMKWGDFNRDGKLDVIIVGETADGPSFNIYQNINAAPATTPGTPNPLSFDSRVEGFEVLLDWQPVSSVANSRGLSYNVYLGSSTNLSNPQSQRSGHAITDLGYRQVVKVGQVNDTTTFRLKNLTPGDYIWAVQAIDADFEGGPFTPSSNRGTFTYAPPIFRDQTRSLFGTLPNGLDKGELEWGDYDNDGVLDLLLTGLEGSSAVTKILKNNYNSGNNTRSFIDVSIPLAGVSESSVEWVDVNNDNLLDIFVMGKSPSGPIARVYLQGTTGGFSTVWASPPGVFNGAADWADFDNDGDMDLVLMGDQDTGIPLLQVLQNTGTGLTAYQNFSGLQAGDVNFVDVNNDGYMDIFATGLDGAANRTVKLLSNNGAGAFSDENVSAFLALDKASTSWGDYNNDGFPDLVMCGSQGTAPTCRIYTNNGGFSFSQKAILVGVENGEVAWGDYDNDGYLDLVAVGTGTSANRAEVFGFDPSLPNGGNFVRREIGALPLEAVGDGASLAWGDYNNDGKLDLALLGEGTGAQVLKIYENIDTSIPAALTPPVSLVDTVFGDSLVFSWQNPGSTPAIEAGYTYNLAIGTSPNNYDILSPLSNESSGLRKVAHMGNTGNNKSWSIIGLPAGTYYWKVQVVDQDYEGGPWTNERSVVYVPPAFRNVNATNINGIAPTGYSQGDLAFGDFDNSNSLDLIASGIDEAGQPQTLLLKNKNGIFSIENLTSNVFLNVSNSDIAWADYNNDDNLDVLILGNAGNGNLATRIYDNTGGDFSFNIQLSSLLENVQNGEADWADFDHDGDLDLALTGANASGDPFSAVYENVREQGTFVPINFPDLIQVNESSVAWGDFNADGYPDLAIAGRNGGLLHTKVYRNNGPLGGFTDMGANAPIVKIQQGSLAWADFDSDGYQDLLVTGETTLSQIVPVTRVYRYLVSQGRFAETGQVFEGVKGGKGIWGDYNDDGYPDFLVSGQNGPSQGSRATVLYTYDGATSFTFTRDTVTSDYLRNANIGASPAFGDFDIDGKMDLVLSGQMADASPRKGFILYKNTDPNPNVRPDAPMISPAIVSADSVNFNWMPPANIPSALQPGHSYQLILRNIANNNVIISPMSIEQAGLVTDGVRKIGAIGSTGNVNSWSIRGLGAGTYDWSVQAIGADLEGSPFAAFDTFTYTPPIFVKMDQLVFSGALPEGLTASSMDWGDFDRDGDLDLLVSGQSASADFGTFIYRNIDQRTLQLETALSNKLVDIREGKVTWVDINEDGYLDITVSGLSATGAVSRIYTSQSGADFTENIFPVIPDLSASDFDWGDYDNDGDLDLLISGTGGGSQIVVVKNNGTDGFGTPSPAIGIPQLDKAKVAWIDANNDGYLDMLIAGESGGNGSFYLIQNMDNETFGAATDLSLPNITDIHVDLGDIDNDGDTDMVVNGLSGSNPTSSIFKNDGNGTFATPGISLPTSLEGELILGDYTDDDKLDIISTGLDTNGDPITLVFKQASNGVFTEDLVAMADLSNISSGDLAWTDYDGDGKLDVSISGTGATPVFSIFRNNERTANNPTAPPTAPDQVVDGSKVKLTWSAPANSTGYTYNVSIGITENDEFIKAGMSELPDNGDGRRRIVASGNVGQNLEWRIGGLVSGRKYYWRVQSVGLDYEGSTWAKGTFTFNPPGYEEVTNTLFPAGVPAGLTEGVVAAVDYDRDGDMDFFRSGTANNAGVSEIYTNNYTSVNQGQFDRDPTASLAINDLKETAAVWGDYNNDGDPDLIISGIDNASPGNHRIFVYKNEGGTFSPDVAAAENLNPLSNGSAALADLDNDGDLDLIMTGNDPSGIPKAYMYENKNGVFEENSNPFPETRNGTIKCADFDKDGDMDVLVSGESLASGATTQIFRNVGDMVFQTVPGLSPTQNSSADWADYDNDGFLDIIISGDNISPLTPLYRYDPTRGDGEFVNIDTSGVRNITQGNILWGDFNNDGWPDVIAHGQTNGNTPADRSSLLFRNNGQGAFTEDLFTSQKLRNMAQGHSAWIDYDNDGQLDVIMTGRDVSDNPVFSVFHNIDTIQSDPPPAPEELVHEVDGATLVLNWEAPSGFDAATVDGLSYNLYLGTTANKGAVIAPHSDTISGYRKIHARGNAEGGLSWRINNLPDGEYVWSVQTVDQGYEASDFGPEQSINFSNPQPIIVQESFAPFINWEGNNVESSIIIDDLNIVDGVFVYYRGITDSSAFTKVQINSPTNPYIFDINTGMVDELGVEYYFEVLGTTPGFNAYSDTGYTHINYPSGMPYEYTDMAFGKDVTDYNVLSIPLALVNPAISAALERFGEYDIFEWRFWHYQNGKSLEYTEGLETLETGKGYWLITKDSRDFNPGPGHVPQVKKSDPFTLTLETGWNQIGNPYAFNLSWNDILNANEDDVSKIQGAPLGYTSSGFQAVTTISKYRGAFVRVNEPVSLKIPVIKNNSINRTGWLFEPDLPSPDLHTAAWKLGIHMKSGGLHSRLPAIGMHPEAEHGRDKFDWYAAPRPSQYLDLKFKREADDIRSFVRDIVPTQKNFIWEFSINSNLSDPYVELSWNNESFGNGGLQLYLFDEERQKLVNMADISSYNSYSEAETRKFKILFGSPSFIEEQIEASKVLLGMAYPVPAAGNVSLPFSLPGKGQDDFEVKMEVLTQTGQTVAVWNDTYQGGFHEIIWDGKSETGKRLSAGLYIYRLTVVSFGKQEIQVQKLILK